MIVRFVYYLFQANAIILPPYSDAEFFAETVDQEELIH